MAELAWVSVRRYGELTTRLAHPSLDKLRKQCRSSRSYPKLRGIDVQPAKLVVQRLLRHAQDLGGRSDIAVLSSQRFGDQRSLDVFELFRQR